MSDPVQEALALWGLQEAACHFVTGRENRVYKVAIDGDSYALRFKRPGYMTHAALLSELDWMTAMDRAGLSVPAPCPSRNGTMIEEIDGQFFDLITWMDGIPLGASRRPLTLPNARDVFRSLGVEMAKLHGACDAWTPPRDFTRVQWDAKGLVGDAPVWGRFWENPLLDTETRALLETFRDRAHRDLDALTVETGLIHADLVRENVLICSDGSLSLIDFDDGGFGFRLFDIATALLKNRFEPNYPSLKAALLDGYHSIREIDFRPLPLFMALRAVTYVGWIVPRMDEPDAQVRHTRFVQDARDLCSAYLEISTVS